MSSQNGELLDAHGSPLSVRAKGNHIVVTPSTEYRRRVLALKARRLGRLLSEEDLHKELRELSDTVAVATVDEGDAHDMYENALDGVQQTVSVTVDGTSYSGVIGSGVEYTESNEDGCEEYSNVHEVGQSDPVYKITCCSGDDECEVYDLSSGSSNGRRLCFAPLTLVDVEDKGPTYLKDVQLGDKVLVQAGKYQEVYTFSHHSKTEKSDFVQLVTDDTTLELSDHHMVYLHGKSGPVAANVVQVGDMLVGPEHQPLAVTKTGRVTRDGFYHPLTADGTIVANGVLASTHANHFDSEEYLVSLWGFNMIHAVTMEDFVERPMRQLCLGVSRDFCNKFTFMDKDADIERNFYDKAGRYWRDDICEAYGFPAVVNVFGSLMFVLICNVLTTPNLVIGLLLLFIGRKTGTSVKLNVKKIKSV